MSTPYLGLDHIAEGQTNKETTANAAFDGLDASMNGLLTLAITGDVNLTEIQFKQTYVVQLTGTPGSGFTVTIPTGISKAWSVSNQTDASVALEFEDAASDAVVVNSGATAILYTTGTEILDLGGGTTAGGPGGGGQTITIEDEGGEVSAPSRLNFVGAGVNASENSDGTVDVVIPGGNSTTFLDRSADFEITNAMLAGNVIVRVNNASDITCFIEPGTTGTEPVTILQTGAGQVVFVDASAVSMRSRGGTLTAGRYSAVSVIPEGSDAFYLVGDLVE